MSYEYMSGLGRIIQPMGTQVLPTTRIGELPTAVMQAPSVAASQRREVEMARYQAELERESMQDAMLEQQKMTYALQPAMLPSGAGTWMEPGRPVAPPQPTSPRTWRGNFNDCKAKGGTVSWVKSSPIATTIGGLATRRESALQGMHGMGMLIQPSHLPFDTGLRQGPRIIPRVTQCYDSGLSRTNESSPTTTRLSFLSALRGYEKEQCCYPQSFIDQKQADTNAQWAAYEANMAAYKKTPAYLAYQKELQEYNLQRTINTERKKRAHLLLHPVTDEIGDPCSPPPGGVVGKYYAPVPTTPEGMKAQAAANMELQRQGCDAPFNRAYDMDNLRVCCPPGVVVPAAPVVVLPPEEVPEEVPTTTNGNGAVVKEEKKYFGFTVMELMLGAAGTFVVYSLLKK